MGRSWWLGYRWGRDGVGFAFPWMPKAGYVLKVITEFPECSVKKEYFNERTSLDRYKFSDRFVTYHL